MKELIRGRAFGPQAERAAERFPVLDAVFCDVGSVVAGYREALARRLRGEPFYGMLLWDDPRSRLARDVGAAVLAQIPHLDDRRHTLDQLADGSLVANGVAVGQYSPVDPPTRVIVQEFVELCTGQLFWSNNEAERFVELFGRRRTIWEIVRAPSALPDFVAGKPAKERVVIWAPDLPASSTALLAFAFEEWRGDAFVICAGGEPPNLRATYVAADDPRVSDVLHGAALIVDASLSDPGSALTFAERGVPLLTASTSGAHEFVQDAIVYDPWHWRSVYYGALRALGRPTRLLRAAELPPPLTISATDWSKGAPLASCIVPTYNRPDELHGALEALAAQTYPNVQVVVVNDGGASVAEVCARFPQVNVKLLDRTENVKAVRAMNVGFEAADGKYLCICPDDDRVFPDHIERLVDALERSGEAVAHSNCLVRYFNVGRDGVKRETGFNASVYVNGIDPTEALIQTSVHATSFMWRRDFLEEIGYWDAEATYADYEIQLRMSLREKFVHVDHFTTSWILRDDATNLAASIGAGEMGADALRYIFAKFPAEGRPAIAQRREAMIELVRGRSGASRYFIPPTFEIPE